MNFKFYLWLGSLFYGHLCYPHINWLPAQTLSSPGEVPQVAMNNNGQAVAIWKGTVGADTIIQIKYSTNGGQGWNSSPLNLSVAGQNADLPQIAMNDNGQVVAVWKRFNGSYWIIQMKYSTDGGQSWSASAIDLSAGGKNADVPKVAMNNNGQVVAVWKRVDDNSPYKWRIQTKCSLDGGQTWSASATNLSDSTKDSDNPQIAMNNSGKVVMIWEINFLSYLWFIQTKYSTDGGQNWSGTAISLTPTSNSSREPQIAMNESGQAIAIWRYHNARWIIQVKYSPNGGQSWVVPATGLNLTYGLSSPSDPGDSFDCKVVINGSGNAIATWIWWNGFFDIAQIKYSRDGGINWSLNPIDLSDRTLGHGNIPQLRINDKEEAVAIWAFKIGPEWIIQTKCSIDAGQCWSNDPVNQSVFGQISDLPQIALNENGQVVGIWEYGNDVQAAYGLFGFDVFSDQFRVGLLLQEDYIDKLYWDNIPDASSYRVYANFSSKNISKYNSSIVESNLLHKVYEGTKPKAYIHGVKNKSQNRYYITWVNNLGNESVPQIITLP